MHIVVHRESQGENRGISSPMLDKSRLWYIVKNWFVQRHYVENGDRKEEGGR